MRPRLRFYGTYDLGELRLGQDSGFCHVLARAAVRVEFAGGIIDDVTGAIRDHSVFVTGLLSLGYRPLRCGQDLTSRPVYDRRGAQTASTLRASNARLVL